MSQLSIHGYSLECIVNEVNTERNQVAYMGEAPTFWFTLAEKWCDQVHKSAVTTTEVNQT